MNTQRNLAVQAWVWLGLAVVIGVTVNPTMGLVCVVMSRLCGIHAALLGSRDREEQERS